MKKIILSTAFLTGGMSAFAQPTQLSKWFASPVEVNFTTAAYPSVVQGGAPASGSGTLGYNSWYESGKLQFYVIATSTGGEVYNGNHQLIATLSGPEIQGPIAIIPHGQNYLDLCHKKYWIISNHRGSTYLPSSNGAMRASLLNMSGTPAIQSQNTLFLTYLNSIAIAVGGLYPNGDRDVYFGGNSSNTLSGLQIVKFYGAGGFSMVGGNASWLPRGNEMEWSNAGNRLALVNSGLGTIYVLPNNPGSGIGPHIAQISGTNIKGLEFDATGNKLYFSDQNGVNVYNFSNSSVTTIAGTAAYASGMLEKSYNASGTQYHIICGNAWGLARINPVTDALDLNWTSPVPGLIMPVQIDGEDVDDPMLKIVGTPVFKKCSPATFNIGIQVHPELVQNFSSLYSLKEQMLNPPYSTTPLALNTSSRTYNLTATSSYSIILYKTSNPSQCPVTKSYSLYAFKCGGPIVVDNDLGNNNPGSARIISTPTNPTEEEAMPGFYSTWEVSRLEPEGYMPVYSVSGDCWVTGPGEQMMYQHFDDIENDYEGGVTLDCDAGADEGFFRYNSIYYLKRTVYADEMDPEVYEDIIETGEYDEGQAKMSGVTSASNPSMIEELPGFEIYPNPSTGTVKINSGSEEPVQVEIYDLAGNRIQLLERLNSQTQLDLSGLSKGVYLIRVTSGAASRVEKLLLN